MNIYILEDDLMQQTRISDIIRESVSYTHLTLPTILRV